MYFRNRKSLYAAAIVSLQQESAHEVAMEYPHLNGYKSCILWNTDKVWHIIVEVKVHKRYENVQGHIATGWHPHSIYFSFFLFLMHSIGTN